MTKEEAKNFLFDMFNLIGTTAMEYWTEKDAEKMRQAVLTIENESAQPESQWTPCSDPSDLPKDKRLWITREISDGFFTLIEVSDVIWDMTEWSGSVSNVVAYMPYWEPEPYTERREE